MDELCHWCQEEIDFGKDYILLEGFSFCDVHCENSYYADREKRKQAGKPTLSVERQNESI